MKRLLILFMLAGIGGSLACSKDTTDETDDSDDDDDDDDTSARDAGSDAARTGDSAVRGDSTTPVMIKVQNPGASCTGNRDCMGPMASCETSLGEGDNEVELEDGYCTAMCASSAECSSGGGCPFSEITAGIPMVGFNIGALLVLPSYCLDKCTAGDDDACRDGYDCKSVLDFVPADIKNGPFGGFLRGPAWTTTYCMPPVEIDFPSSGTPDAGRPDAGGTSVTAVDGGLDAG